VTATFYTRFGKRWFDAAASFAGIVLLSPFLAAVAIAVRLTSAGPVLFRQERSGRFEKPFHILKFRTMKVQPPGAGLLVTVAEDPRVTPLGRWLRKTKIDELPQLFNVLAGDMSLVGPRPEVSLYTAIYSANQKRVLLVRPGITSPKISFDEEALLAGNANPERFYRETLMPAKLELDLAYCENICFAEDLHILFRTVGQVFGTTLHQIKTPPSHLDSSSCE